MAYDRDNRSGNRGGGGGFRNRPSFSNRSTFRDRPRFDDQGSSDRPQMHQAVCDNCGKNCEVPFRPTQGKPVYCSSCFENNRGTPSYKPHETNAVAVNNYKEHFESLNRKIDKILGLLSPGVTTAKPKKVKVPKKVEPIIEAN